MSWDELCTNNNPDKCLVGHPPPWLNPPKMSAQLYISHLCCSCSHSRGMQTLSTPKHPRPPSFPSGMPLYNVMRHLLRSQLIVCCCLMGLAL
eukprot:scaffold78336_cov18-Tisochrysis_lutea.AAC.9